MADAYFNVIRLEDVISAPLQLADTKVTPALAVRWQGGNYYNPLVSPDAENALPVHLTHDNTVYALSTELPSTELPTSNVTAQIHEFTTLIPLKESVNTVEEFAVTGVWTGSGGGWSSSITLPPEFYTTGAWTGAVSGGSASSISEAVVSLPADSYDPVTAFVADNGMPYSVYGDEDDMEISTTTFQWNQSSVFGGPDMILEWSSDATRYYIWESLVKVKYLVYGITYTCTSATAEEPTQYFELTGRNTVLVPAIAYDFAPSGKMPFKTQVYDGDVLLEENVGYSVEIFDNTTRARLISFASRPQNPRIQYFATTAPTEAQLLPTKAIHSPDCPAYPTFYAQKKIPLFLEAEDRVYDGSWSFEWAERCWRGYYNRTPTRRNSCLIVPTRALTTLSLYAGSTLLNQGTDYTLTPINSVTTDICSEYGLDPYATDSVARNLGTLVLLPAGQSEITVKYSLV